MKKILFVATVAKKHICQFHIPYLKWFHDQGYEVHVCAKNDFEYKDIFDVPYCDRFFNVHFSRSPFSGQNLTAYKQLKEIISSNDYDLIHCHTPVAAAMTRIAARKARKKKHTVVLYTTHGFHFFKGAPSSSKIYYIAEKKLIKYTDGIITINREDHEMAKMFCEGKKCRAYYIHGMGVDTKTIAAAKTDKRVLKKKFGIPEDAFVLLSVSEINQNKNLTVTLKAFSKIKHRDIYYLICGTGQMMDECVALAKELGISDRVIFAGYRYDIYHIVHIADVFLFPSLREGLGVAAIEAMSAGVPIVGSDIRGVREYAVNMKNSLLLEPTDADGFAEAIEKLYGDEELRKTLGRNALLSVPPFDINNSVKSITDIYREYLEIPERQTQESAEKESVAAN